MCIYNTIYFTDLNKNSQEKSQWESKNVSHYQMCFVAVSHGWWEAVFPVQ